MTAAAQRAVVALIEPLVVKRKADWGRHVQEIASELGVPRAALLFLYSVPVFAVDGIVTLAAQRDRTIYLTKEPWRATWAALVAGGLAAPLGDGWRLTPAGAATVQRLHLSSQQHLASLALPAVELAHARRALEGIVERVGAETQRMRQTRRIEPRGEGADADAAQVEFLILLLLGHRIDAHISAWRAEGYLAAELDALSQVWGGLRTLADIEGALATKQEPAEVRANLARLAERRDLVLSESTVRITEQGQRTRDRIEAETDCVALAPWPDGDALRQLRQDLELLASSLPEQRQPGREHPR